MPGRTEPITTGEIYHVYNRGIDRRPTFTNKREYERAFLTLRFYRFVSPAPKLSHFLELSKIDKDERLSRLEAEGQKLVEFFAYCLMPNHFHFLLKQVVDRGISIFLSNFQNSYTRYSNIGHKRTGPLLLDQFKAVRVETDEQFLHVHRYIHLNPFTSYVVKTVEDLVTYPWVSLKEYWEKDHGVICDTSPILSHYKNNREYRKFILNQTEYQRKLEAIKHLLLEE